MEIKENNLVRLKIDTVINTDESIKENDFHLFEKLKKSIALRGQLKNIVVFEKENNVYECIEGNKTLKALKLLGFKEVFAINLGKLSSNEIDLIKIEVSRDYFMTDYVLIGKLLKKLKELKPLNELCNTIPYDVRQATNLVEMSDFDWEKFSQLKENENQVKLFSFDEEVTFEQKQDDNNIQTDLFNFI